MGGVLSDGGLLERCRSFREAVRLCWESSGLGMKQVAAEIEMEVRTLSRCLSLNDEDRRYLPDDKLVPFMIVCGNTLPLRWLSLQLGEPSGDLLRQELENERLVRETERRIYFQTLSRIQRSVLHGRRERGTQAAVRFSLAAGVPEWLAAAAEAIECNRAGDCDAAA